MLLQAKGTKCKSQLKKALSLEKQENSKILDFSALIFITTYGINNKKLQNPKLLAAKNPEDKLVIFLTS